MRAHYLYPLLACCLAAVGASALFARDDVPPREDVTAGYRHLLETAYLPPAFDQETFDAVWRVWPEPLRSEAERATPDERRRLAYRRYGLTERPGDDDGKPLQYVVDEAGRWSMNCLACHAGTVAGRAIPGLPNSHLALQTFAEEIRDTKRLLGKRLLAGDLALPFFPLGETNGTTNAVMFSVSLLTLRDRDLNRKFRLVPPRFVHHDLDAPAWWNVKKRTHLYLTGFAPKGARPLLQFTLVPQNGPEQLRAWESDYEDVLAWIESLEPPAWPFAVDAALAAQGRTVFERSCADCHGTYGDAPTYPNRRVPIDVVGTDRVRLDAIDAAQRTKYAESWFTDYDPSGVVTKPDGYVAPPLDGIWATAPYLHNGSVPTLWHLFHPEERPVVWRRSVDGYDRERVGLEVETFEALPDAAREDAKVRRTYFDTTKRGKSAAGHPFPSALSAEEKRAVLEYLKTL